MPERPHPKLDRVRDALRDADDREAPTPAEPEPEPAEHEDDEDA